MGWGVYGASKPRVGSEMCGAPDATPATDFVDFGSLSPVDDHLYLLGTPRHALCIRKA